MALNWGACGSKPLKCLWARCWLFCRRLHLQTWEKGLTRAFVLQGMEKKANTWFLESQCLTGLFTWWYTNTVKQYYTELGKIMENCTQSGKIDLYSLMKISKTVVFWYAESWFSYQHGKTSKEAKVSRTKLQSELKVGLFIWLRKML